MSATLIVPRDIASSMLGQACATCRFVYKDEHRELNCRRHPPTAFLAFTPGGPKVITTHPIVAADQWCGEWEERGNSRMAMAEAAE